MDDLESKSLSAGSNEGDPVIEQSAHIQQKIMDLQIRVQEDENVKADHSDVIKYQPTTNTQPSTKTQPLPEVSSSVESKIAEGDAMPAESAASEPVGQQPTPVSPGPPPDFTTERCLVFTGAFISGERNTDVYAVRLDGTLQTVKLGTLKATFPPKAEYNAISSLVVQDNMLYMSGLGPRGSEVWQYSIMDRKSSLVTRLQTGRDEHAMTMLDDNQLLVLGGMSPPGSGHFTGSVELVDLNERSSRRVGNITYKVGVHLTCYHENKKVLLFGAMGDDYHCCIQVWDVRRCRVTHAINIPMKKVDPVYGICAAHGYLVVVAHTYTYVVKLSDILQGRSRSLTMCDNYVTPNVYCSVVVNNQEDKILLLGGQPKEEEPEHYVYEASVKDILANKKTETTTMTGWKKVETPWSLGKCDMTGGYDTAYISVPK